MTKKLYLALLTLVMIMTVASSSVTTASETGTPSLGCKEMLFFVGGKYQFSLKNAPAGKVEGKTYYVDGTPGSMIVYLSDETKPVFYATSMFGDWTVMLDNIPGHETAGEDAA